MRADARRNRVRLLEAAVEVILEAGGSPSRDAIATRAGVGIATLYRHFPDQQDLFRATSAHIVARTLAAGDAALADGADPAASLRGYLHAAIDHGVGALGIVVSLLDPPHWPAERSRAETILRSLVERAQASGQLRSDVTVRDVGFAIIRSSRPLGLGLPAEEERAAAHRHVDLVLDGMLARSV